MHDPSILNPARLEEAFGDDVADIADLLEMSLVSGARYLGELRAGVTAGDFALVAQAAHSIKGSAANVGAGGLTAVAATIESHARDRSWDGVASWVGDLEQAYAKLRVGIAEYCAAAAPRRV